MKQKILFAAGLIICLCTTAYSSETTVNREQPYGLLKDAQSQKDDNFEWWLNHQRDWGFTFEVPGMAEPYIEDPEIFHLKSVSDSIKKPGEFSVDMIDVSPENLKDELESITLIPLKKTGAALPTPENYQW